MVLSVLGCDSESCELNIQYIIFTSLTQPHSVQVNMKLETYLRFCFVHLRAFLSAHNINTIID